MKAVLFDLDETLTLEEPLNDAAFLAAAQLALPLGADPVNLAERARAYAHAYWQDGPCYEYCRRIGHGPGEVLWADYPVPANHPEVDRLREWAPGHRVRIWREALAGSSVADGGLAQRMADRFITARRGAFVLFPEVPALLRALRSRGYLLGVVTNGIGALQREKLTTALLPDGKRLADEFDAIAVSGEVDCGKPDPGIFHHICRTLGITPADAVMVGDNPERDVAGAMAAGLRSVWINRDGRQPDPRYPADLVATHLSAILPWLG